MSLGLRIDAEKLNHVKWNGNNHEDCKGGEEMVEQAQIDEWVKVTEWR